MYGVRHLGAWAMPIDDIVAILGEYAFAQWAYGDWRKNRVGANKGQVDFVDVEVKTSAFPFRDTLNLLVREDYGNKRKPPFYVQVILDVAPGQIAAIPVGTRAIVSGWATSEEVDGAPLRDFGSKFGGRGGYRCFHIPIHALHEMATFPKK